MLTIIRYAPTADGFLVVATDSEDNFRAWIQRYVINGERTNLVNEASWDAEAAAIAVFDRDKHLWKEEKI